MTRIGFIGAGQMARALARGFVAANETQPRDLAICDPSTAAIEAFRTELSDVSVFDHVDQCIANVDLVFVAVKPQHIDSVFRQMKPAKCLFASIAAGVSLSRLVTGLKSDRVIRVMPNTPCLVGAGAAAYCLGPGASKADGQQVGALLNAVGIAFELAEHQMDAVTGLSGSGPAYVYQMIEALSDGGVRVGLPRQVATALAAQTVLGAARLVLETGQHPGVLKDQVTSPGGTTIAGLHALELGGARAAMIEAVLAATQRSRELGQG